MTTTAINPKSQKSIDDAGLVIESYVKELEARIARARTFAPEQALVVEFLRAFAHVESAPDYEGDVYGMKLRAGFTLDPSTVNALIVNFDADSLPEVVEPLKWFAARLGKYEIDDYQELGRRSYVFANGGRPVRFQVFFNSAKSVCKFVEVGKEEKPIYKLMCDGAEQIEAVAV